MKKVLIVFLAILGIFAPVIETYASTELPNGTHIKNDYYTGITDTGTNSKGQYTDGGFYYEYHDSGKVLYTRTFKFLSSEIVVGEDSTEKDYQGLYIVLKYENDVPCYYLCSVDGKTISTNYTTFAYDHPDYGGKAEDMKTWGPYDANYSSNYRIGIGSYEDFSFFTNLPIFDYGDDESINAYIENGNIDGATNGEYLKGESSEYDESVEEPRNVMTYGKITNDVGETKLTVRFYPPENNLEEYSYDVRFKIHYLNRKGENEYIDTEYMDAVTNYPYERNDSYDINTGEPVKRDSSVPEDFIIDAELLRTVSGFEKSDKGFWFNPIHDSIAIKTITIQVRNRRGDKHSHWKTIESTAGGGSWMHDEDDSGNVVESNDSGNVDNSDNHIYDEFAAENGGGTNTNIDINSIMSYIRSGFGLLGNGGLIALMSGTFSYIPASVWTLIKMAIAMSIMVMLLALVKRFVFG